MTQTLWQSSIQAMMRDNERVLQPHEQQAWQFSTSKAFGETLVRYGSRYKNMVVLDANSSKFLNTGAFAQVFPDRYFNFGNAEENMMSAAAGFTVRGKIPFVCTFSMFATGRAWEQIRNAIGYPYLNVKIIGSHAGILSGEDGATYQALEDMAIMRAIPNMKVFCPSDAVETKKMVEAMMNDYGPAYLRLTSHPVPILNEENYEFTMGRGRVYKPGTDVCIFAIGTAVAFALEASEQLDREGISTMVVNISSLRPLDENLIVECAKQARSIVTVEDHNIVGGLGSAVMETLSTHYPMKVLRLGMNGYGESGRPEDLYKKYRLDAAGIVEQVKDGMKG